MKKRLFIRIPISIALILLVSSQMGIAQSAEGMHAIQLTDYPSQIEVGDFMTIKGWVTFTQPTTNYPVYAVLVIEGSKMQCSAKWLPEGTVPETAVQLGTYTYDGNIYWVWYVPEIDNGVTYTVYALDRETAKIKSNTLTYTVGGTVETKPPPPPPESFNFGITATSSSISIQQGQSGSVTYSVALLDGIAQTVSLSLSGLPSGCTYSLDPSSGTPPFSSTLILNVGASTSTGSYTLIVTGTSSSLTRRSSLSLIVTPSIPLTYSLIVTTQPSGIVMWRLADSYRADSVVHLGTAPETVEGRPGIRYVFQYWKVDGVKVYDNPLTITMDKNHAAVAVYKTQYYLTVQSAQATPSQPSGYQDANSIITVSVPETVNSQYDSQYICKSYLLDDVSHSGNSACVTMDGPHILAFVWTLQFYLILTCAITGPSLLGENWYDYGATATIQAQAAFLASDGKQYQFYQWVSTGAETPHLANASASTTTLVMNSPGYQLEAQYSTTNQTITNSSRLYTDGRWIRDAAGNIVRLKGAEICWRFRFASHYHDYDPLSYNDEINETSMDTFKSTGANFIRLALNGWVWYVKRAPKYIGAVDTVIGWCKARGIMVVLDNHAPWFDTDNGVDYRDQYALVTQLTEWKNFMIELAERYKNEPTVIGFDMLNEPTGYPENSLDWNTWRTNVLEVVRAIHAVDPTYICFVEPLGSCGHSDDMTNFKINPLPEPNIVYSAHIYYAWDYPYEEYAINYGKGDFELAKQQMEATYYERFLDMLDAGLPTIVMETGVYGHARESDNPNWKAWMNDSLTLYEKYDTGVSWLGLYPDRSDSSLFSILSSDRRSLTDLGVIWAMHMNKS